MRSQGTRNRELAVCIGLGLGLGIGIVGGGVLGSCIGGVSTNSVACGSMDDCAAGQACVAGVCTAICLSDADCAPAESCVDSSCRVVHTECTAAVECLTPAPCQTTDAASCRGGTCHYQTVVCHQTSPCMLATGTCNPDIAGCRGAGCCEFDPAWPGDSSEPQPACPLAADDPNDSFTWSGLCNHDGACAGCTDVAQCNSQNQCAVDFCGPDFTCQVNVTSLEGRDCTLASANDGACVVQGAATATCLLKDGQRCDTPGQCISGFCADGVCCNNACNGTCNQCNAVGAEGVCSAKPSSCTGNCVGCVAATAASGSIYQCEAQPAACVATCTGACTAASATQFNCGSTYCGGNCVACDGAGTCVASPSACYGTCSNCTATGANTYSCGLTRCSGGCVSCNTGSGACVAAPSACDASCKVCDNTGTDNYNCSAGSKCGGNCVSCDGAGGCVANQSACNGNCSTCGYAAVNTYNCGANSCGACTRCNGSGSCVYGDYSTSDCTTNYTCYAAGVCRKANLQSCTASAECASDLCLARACTAALWKGCASDGDCTGYGTCGAGLCLWNGAICSAAVDGSTGEGRVVSGAVQVKLTAPGWCAYPAPGSWVAGIMTSCCGASPCSVMSSTASARLGTSGVTVCETSCASGAWH
ncbi:MAG: hypothetical protein HY903_08445 [Deltaproteobacteria bacterium]|nr:hypothetical protein [Deltaproteobacteria bacterium]